MVQTPQRTATLRSIVEVYGMERMVRIRIETENDRFEELLGTQAEGNMAAGTLG